MTASERIREARSARKINTAGTVRDTLLSYRDATPEARQEWAEAQSRAYGITADKARAIIERNLHLVA